MPQTTTTKKANKSGVSEGAEKTRKSIQSVEIGARVLEALIARRDGSGFLRDVADQAGLSRSQAHRYLLAFVNSGLVEQDPATGRYGLGSMAVRLGLAAMARMDFINIATNELRVVLEDLQTTGLLSIWGDFGPTVVRWIEGGTPLYTSLRIGSVLPLQTSSTGNVVQAFMPPSHYREVLERERRSGIKIDGDEIAAKIAEVRKTGYAHVSGGVVPGLSGLSAPIFDSQARVVAVMSVLNRSVDDDHLPTDRFDQLLDAARRASTAIGWNGEYP